MQVQIDPAHQTVTAARHALFAEAPGAGQLPVQAVCGDRIQLVAGCPPLMSGVQSTMSSVLLQSSEP